MRRHWQKGLRGSQVVRVTKEAYRRGLGDIGKADPRRNDLLADIRNEFYPKLDPV